MLECSSARIFKATDSSGENPSCWNTLPGTTLTRLFPFDIFHPPLPVRNCTVHNFKPVSGDVDIALCCLIRGFRKTVQHIYQAFQVDVQEPLPTIRIPVP
jgi:hypothetical protein